MNLVDLLARRCHLLLDFDGPICAVFAGYPAQTATNELRAVVVDRLGIEPADIADLAPDPLRILRRVAGLGDHVLTRAVADRCRDAEVRAIGTAAPTPGACEVLHAARAGGRPVAIVSNNSIEAVRSYLGAHDLSGYVGHIAARHDGMDPLLLKPDPYLVRSALYALTALAGDAVLVGDSAGDIEAGRAAGVATIGYANKPGKRGRLADARADLVVDTMAGLADALSSTGIHR